MKKLNDLHKRILEISSKKRLTHIGSCLTSVGIIDSIYRDKKPYEPFILSCGHAGLALYVVLEKYFGFDAEEIFDFCGTHPERSEKYMIDCSTGSLGHGLGIAVGMSLADRSRKVHCLLSDGECYEGIVWEAANVITRYNITNLNLHINWNGWSAYNKVEEWMLSSICTIFPDIKVYHTKVEDYGLNGLTAHYVKVCDVNLGEIYTN